MSLKNTFSERRLSNKKRKAQAFLDLIRSQNGIEPAAIKTDNTSSFSNTSPEAIVKHEDGSRGISPNKKRKQSTTIEVVEVIKDNQSLESKVKVEVDDVLAETRRILRERQKAAMKRPKIFLTLDELTRDTPSDNPDEVKETPPLVMLDIQHLLLLGIMQNKASISPRWCRLLRMGKLSKVVAVVLDSVSSEDLNTYPESLPTLKQAFDIEANIIPPVQYGSSVREDLFNVQISDTKIKKVIGKFDLQKHSVKGKEKREVKAEIVNLLRMKKDDDIDDDIAEPNVDLFDRTHLLLNTSQLLQENIPLPFGPNEYQYKNYVFSKDKYTDVSNQSPMFGIDCEMVQSTSSMMDLARVSIVNEDLKTIYDTYVKPKAHIKDYVTRFSGITKQIMDNCNTYLEDVQKHLQKLIPSDAILCGQSIGGDLRSLKMFHPYVIDTSVIFNLTGKRHMKTGLKRLAAHFLSEEIQTGNKGHSSVEDALTTIQLVKYKLSNGIDYGDLSWNGLDPIDLFNPTTNNTNNNSETGGTGDETVKGVTRDGALSRAKRFFSHGKRNTEFILKHIVQDRRKGTLIDEPEAKCYYPESEGMVYLETDKLRQKETVKCLEEKDFCLTHLYAFRDLISSLDRQENEYEEKKRKCLKKMDKRIGKIMSKIPANSLFVVILSSGLEGNEPTAKVLCKITGPQET